MKYLFDTNAVILAIDGRCAPFRARLAAADEGDVVISSIVLAEVAYGSEWGKFPEFRVLDVFLEEVAVLPFDEQAARHYAKLPFRRGGFDRLIAAHALSIGATVVTNNEADFADVPGLMVENWTI